MCLQRSIVEAGGAGQLSSTIGRQELPTTYNFSGREGGLGQLDPPLCSAQKAFVLKSAESRLCLAGGR